MAGRENDPLNVATEPAQSPESEAATAAPLVDLTAATDDARLPRKYRQRSSRRRWVSTCAPGTQRIRGGDSGVLPVVLGIVVVAIAFEIITPENSYLRASNLVYIFGLSTVYVVLATAEIVVLLLGEIDLSIGSVALLGGTIAFKLVQVNPGPNWPWWAAILATLVCCGFIGALQGTLVSRLKIPSFVVTLGWLPALPGHHHPHPRRC